MCRIAAVEIEFDPAKAAANLRKHQLSFSHAAMVMSDPWALTVEDEAAEGERRFCTLGNDALGRLLVVVYTHRGEVIRIISLRRASRAEARSYHAQRV